jgi:LmbE family N-acetylglucosaminyl deacetylase
MSMSRTVVAAMAHPDDIEFLCAGTLRLLVECGWTLRCVTLSGGDIGAPAGTRETIRATRLREAGRAAAVLGGAYHWAGLDDLTIQYCADQLRAVTDALRACGPDLVITHSPDCYMVDHEETSRLVRMACFAAGMPLFETTHRATGKPVPALYYADAFEGKNKFGEPVIAEFWVDVDSVFETRQAALACYASQRTWLRAHHGVDNYLALSESFARLHGQRCGLRLAEGFRQHLGHGYPQENILAASLAAFVKSRSTDAPRA